MIYTGGGQFRQGKSIFDFEATLGEAVGVSAQEAWLFNPLSSLKRSRELNQAQFGDLEDTDDDDDFFSVTPNTEFLERTPPATETVDADAARKQVRQLGLELNIPDGGIPQGALDILVERKQEEVARSVTLQRSPSGVGPTFLKLGTSLAVSVVDPINVAASFIPVVGQARYARMLKNVTRARSRAAVRAKVGAIEGAAGQVLVEPIVYRAANQEQADYGLADSLLNVAFGTIFGAGLHMGAGAIKDALVKGRPWQNAAPTGEVPARVNSWSPQERMDVSRVVLSQVLSGKQVDVEPIVKLRDAIADVAPGNIQDARVRALDKVRTEVQDELSAVSKTQISLGDKKKLTSERINLKVKLASEEKRVKKLAKSIQKAEGKTERRARQKAKQQIQTENRQINRRLADIEDALSKGDSNAKALADIEQMKQGIVPEKYTARVEAATRKLAAQMRRSKLSTGVKNAIESPDSPMNNAWREVRQSAVRKPGDQVTATADPIAAERIRARVEERAKVAEDVDTAKSELDDEIASLQELADILEAGDVVKTLDSFDEQIKLAESNQKALRAMALCSFGRGG